MFGAGKTNNNPFTGANNNTTNNSSGNNNCTGNNSGNNPQPSSTMVTISHNIDIQ